MTSRLDKAITVGFCALWAILIFIEYWHYHPEYADSIRFFQYTNLTLVLTALGAAIGGGLYMTRNKKKPLFIANGLGILVLFLIISGLIISFHFPKVGGNFSLSFKELLTYISKITGVILASYFVFATAFATGDLLFKYLFSFSFKRMENTLLKIAIGVTVLSILLVLLGAVNLLDIKIILPIFLLILGADWKGIWQFVKATLLLPVKGLQQLNGIGFGSFYLALIFASLAFLQNIRPYPFGFDSLAIYLNLPNLIEQNQGLVVGYSPYYWSLFISLGYILFDQIEVVIALSVAGGIFAAFFIYEICRKWLNANYAILTATLFYSLPMINFQAYRDIKTDLGLLFILLAAILVLIKWLSLEDNTAYRQGEKFENIIKSKGKKNEVATIPKEQKNAPGILGKFLPEKWQLIILLGLFSGMAIGIKLTGLILIFSILSVFAYVKGGQIGFLTAFALCFAVVLIGGLDVATGLRAYHFGTDTLKLIFPVIGLIGLGYFFLKKRGELLELIGIATIYIIFTGSVYLPWPIKNYKETNSISINTFITGKPSNKLMNINQILRDAAAIEAETPALIPNEDASGE